MPRESDATPSAPPVPPTERDPVAERDPVEDGVAPDVPFDRRTADFYSPGVSLSRLRPRPDVAAAPADLLLRALEPPPVKVRHIPLVDLLRKPYRELNGE